MFVDYAARGAAFKAAVAAIAAASSRRARTLGRPTDDQRSPAALAPTPEPAPNTLKREQHQPDYVFLVAVVGARRDRRPHGLFVVGDEASFLSDDDQFKIVGPQVIWAALGPRLDGHR